MSKKLFVLSVVFVLVLALTGSVLAADTFKIGVVTPDADHGFTGESVAHARAELEAKSKELGFEYKFEVGGEAAKQIAALETILEWKPDVIVLWPLEGQQLKNIAMTIMDSGVKLIIYDRLIDGFKPTAEIMGDNESIGKMMGEYLLKYFDEQLKAGETITYLRFIGDSSTVSAAEIASHKMTNINTDKSISSIPNAAARWRREAGSSRSRSSSVSSCSSISAALGMRYRCGAFSPHNGLVRTAYRHGRGLV